MAAAAAAVAAAPAPPALSILEKFNQIEVNYNKNFLLYLDQIMQIVESDQPEAVGSPEHDKDRRQYELLAGAYEHWYGRIQADPRCMDSCVAFYNAVGDGHELLMKRDQQIFTANGDFLSNAFEQTGIDTPYLFNELSDGLDEDAQTKSEEERDAKENFWNMTIGLYRLAAMICIYLKMPVVREIIDMILLDNPDLNQTNMFARIFSKFKGSRRLRKLIMKLMKSKEDNFGDIFTSLQKVIATFSSEVNLDTNMQANIENAKKKVRAAFDQILDQAGVKGLTEEQTTQLIDALEDRNEPALKDLVDERLVTDEQLARVQTLYREQGLDKVQVNKVVKDLGRTMTDMMAAIEKNDEGAVQEILARAGSGLNLPAEELSRMQSEMETLEKEDEDDEEHDEKQVPAEDLPDLVDEGPIPEPSQELD